jgi:hypothetical protein
MASRPPLNLESSFGDILKKEFGTGIPQISTVVAVVLGTLQLKDKFNAAAWTIVAVLCFALVFLYRHQIPNRLPKTTLLVFGFLVFFGVVGFVAYRMSSGGLTLWQWEAANVDLTTAYLSFVTTISVACLITSYRKQERMLGRLYPAVIDTAITKQLSSMDFYKEKIRFDIHVKKLEGEEITFETEYSYTVVNRADGNRFWDMSYNFDRQTGKVLQAEWDKHSIDLQDPRFESGVGIKIPRDMKASQRSTVYFKIQQRFRLRDSETYTSYHPATDLTVTVQNGIDGVRFNFDALHLSQPEVEVDKKNKNNKSLSLDSGLLPFQGIILNWTRA